MRRAALFLLVLSGCAAQMVSHRSAYAPVNEQNGGQVRYLAAGIAPVQQARREDAYRQMFRRCGGRYRIVSEASEAAGSYTVANARGYGNGAFGSASTVHSSWRYITFECVGVEPAEVAEEPSNIEITERDL